MLPGSRRVLVVEDDEVLRDFLSTVLAGEGYETRLAPEGRQALAVLGRWRPDLILLDLVMRDMDGWTFRTEQLLNGYADIPVLVLTAVDGARKHAEGLAAPVISKPFDLDQFLREVERLLG
jgi:two-component system OmpR family response regulator